MTTLPTAWENHGPIAANAPAANYHAAAGRIWRIVTDDGRIHALGITDADRNGDLYSRPVVATIYPTAGVRNAPFSAGAKTW